VNSPWNNRRPSARPPRATPLPPSGARGDGSGPVRGNDELRLYGVNAVLAMHARRPQALRKLYLAEALIPRLQPLLKWCVGNRVGYRVQELRIVDDRGRRITGFGTSVFSELTGGRYVTLRRSDLSRLLFERMKGTTECIFDSEIVGLQQRPDGIRVQLKHGDERRFDLVIGAGFLALLYVTPPIVVLGIKQIIKK